MPQELSRTEYATIDMSDEMALFSYAKKLEGHTFREVLDLGIVPDGVKREYGSKRYKGGMGTLIEERYFCYKANSDERPDFPEAGVELKSTCYDVKKDGTNSAGERLVLTMIPFNRPIEDELEESHLWLKMGRILLVYYRRDKSIESYDQVIEHVALFTPPPPDMPIIEDDYRHIRDVLKAGRAQELSESQTRYLGACTKGTSEATMWARQYYPPHAEAKRRAFCFKRQYMDYVLHHYLEGDEADGESIVKDPSKLAGRSFEDYVLSLIEPYVGKSESEICNESGIPIPEKKTKGYWSGITYHVLGLRRGAKNAEEFKKAGISARTVRLNKGHKPKESLSFDPFRFAELAQEDSFEGGELYRYLSETRFFFVVFDDSTGEYILKGARFWSMPEEDLEGPVRECWERAHALSRTGVELVKRYNKSGNFEVLNNLPKLSDELITHVRPHTNKRAYKLSDGTVVGDLAKHGDRLPDGQWMTRQSFWLNSDYVYKIVSDISR